MQLFHEIDRGQSALVCHEKIGSYYPIFEFDMRTVHESSVRGRNLFTAVFAAQHMPSCNLSTLRAAAEGTYKAFLETHLK
jgi:hypothetical protein